MTVSTNFAGLSGNQPASLLDDSFAQCASNTELAVVVADVAALPGSATPLAPSSTASAGASSELSREDHVHPTQPSLVTTQGGTAFTLTSAFNGKTVEFTSGSAVAVTVANNLPVDFNCLLTQAGAGQATFSAQSGATQRQRRGLTKTAGQWAVVSLYVRANSGGSAAEYILAGDMA